MRNTVRPVPETGREAKPRTAPRPPASAHPVLGLQRTVGNRAAQQMVARDAKTAEKTYTLAITGLGALEIESYSFGSQVSRGTGTGVGHGDEKRPKYGELNVTMISGDASAAIARAVASGTHFDEAVLTTSAVKLTFKDVLLTSFQTGGSTGRDNLPRDSFTLSYADVKFEYGKPEDK